MGESFIVVKAARVLRATKEHPSIREAQVEADRLLTEQPHNAFLIYKRVEVVKSQGADTQEGDAV